MSGDGSTAGMWLRMLGLEPLWQAANSADVQQQMKALVQSILETRLRCERIEAKLDRLLDAGGIHEFADCHTVARFPAIGPTARPRDGSAASLSPDLGTGGDAATVDDAGASVRGVGAPYGTGQR
jgi:hypothetical protein